MNYEVEVKKEHQLECSGAELLAIFMAQGTFSWEGKPRQLPADMDIKIKVPGGGDYSNEWLELNDLEVSIQWTEEYEE